MARKAVVDAVEARLAAGWSRCAIVGFNDDVKTAPPAPFLVVQYPVAREERLTFGALGANLYREEGVIRLVLNTKRTGGAGTALLWADELAALFRGKQFDGVTCFAPSSPAIDDRNGEGVLFTLAVAVPYQHDAVG